MGLFDTGAKWEWEATTRKREIHERAFSTWCPRPHSSYAARSHGCFFMEKMFDRGDVMRAREDWMETNIYANFFIGWCSAPHTMPTRHVHGILCSGRTSSLFHTYSVTNWLCNRKAAGAYNLQHEKKTQTHQPATAIKRWIGNSGSISTASAAHKWEIITFFVVAVCVGIAVVAVVIVWTSERRENFLFIVSQASSLPPLLAYCCQMPNGNIHSAKLILTWHGTIFALWEFHRKKLPIISFTATN